MVPLLVGAGMSLAGGALDAYGTQQGNQAMSREYSRQAQAERDYQRAIEALALRQMGPATGIQGYLAQRQMAQNAMPVESMQPTTTSRDPAAQAAMQAQAPVQTNLSGQRRAAQQQALQSWAERLRDLYGDLSFEERLMQARRALRERRLGLAAQRGAEYRTAGADMGAMGNALMAYYGSRPSASGQPFDPVPDQQEPYSPKG